MPRAATILALAATAVTLAPATAHAAGGDLTQAPDTAGCVSQDGSDQCVDGKGLGEARSVAVSPDGAHVYVASPVAGSSGALTEAVAVFSRDPAGAALSQLAGSAGCVSEGGAGGACANGKALADPIAVTVSPDGRNVYVASEASEGLAVFDRNASTGELTQLTGTAGCVTRTGSGGTCADGEGLSGPQSVTVSPDGTSVHVASLLSNSVESFRRDATTGALTQLTGVAACVSETGSSGACADGKALKQPSSVTVSADGASAYVASVESDAVAAFDRDPATGELTQRGGTSGCVSETGTAGSCIDGKGLNGAGAVTASADGSSVYVTSQVSDAVAVFERGSTGELAQRPGQAGCISETGSSGTCVDGKGLDGAFSVAVSQDGRGVYTASFISDAVAVFQRNATTGELTQRTGAAGCVSETGTGAACVDGRALSDVDAVVVSPDGKSAYAASAESHAVAAFTREPLVETTITAGPEGATSDSTPTFEFISGEPGTTFECRFDGAAWSACSSPYTSAELPDGDHSFEVRAIDSGGTADATPAARQLTLDSSPPETAITSGPSGPTADSTPTFELSSPDPAATFECSVDGQPYEPCTSPHTTTALSEGEHSFAVRAEDPAGNVDGTPATATFTVAGPPETTLSSGPTGQTRDATPTFEFSSAEQGASFECRVDGEAFAACSSPHATTPLADGSHSFEVRAVDAAGNADPTPARSTFTIDTTAPGARIDGGPSGRTGDRRPTFEFSSAEQGASFECRVDSEAFDACLSPYTSAELPDGDHSFEVRATDSTGNVDEDPARRTFTVDSRPSETSLTSKPATTTRDSTPTFAFSASEPGSSFECRLEGGRYDSCSSPLTTARLADGEHRFEVRATDPSGNADESPAGHSFRVDTQPPALTISTKSAKMTKGGSVSVSLVCPASEPSGPCQGTLTLATAEKVRVGKHRRRVTLGSATFGIVAGSRREVDVKLSRSERKLVAELGRFTVKASAETRDRPGNSAKSAVNLVLTAP